ncbi:MAG: hypothetical protein WD960_02485 [Gemmatimonadota bacterium]
MKRLSIDQISGVLPAMEELRPFLDQVLLVSEPDLERHWAGSGELGTVGGRFVDSEKLGEVLDEALAEHRRRIESLYGSVGAALRAMAEEDRAGAAAALLQAGEREWRSGRPRWAEALAEAAARVGASLPDQATVFSAQLMVARTARLLGDRRTARLRYETAARIAEQTGNRSGAATAHVGLGNLAVDRGLWADALRHYEEAESRVDPAAANGHGWQIALNRSIVAREEGRLDDCEALLSNARRLIPERAEHGGSQAILDNAEGQLLRARGRLKEAEVAFRRALEATDDPEGHVTIAVNLAEVLLALGAEMEAGKYARQAELQALEAGVVRRLPEVYRVLGRVAAARGHADAFVFHERALEIIRERSLPQVELALVQEAYGELDHARGETETGIARLEEAMGIFENLGFATARARVTELLRRLEGG